MPIGNLQYTVHFGLLQFGEKALVSEIHAENRNAGTGKIPGKLQNRAVAAKRNNEPRAGQRRRERNGRNTGRPSVFKTVAEKRRNPDLVPAHTQRIGKQYRRLQAVIAVCVRAKKNVSVLHLFESFPCAA